MTETVEHTPGEWHVEERGSYFGVYTEDGRIVAHCAKPHRRALANARLISAADDMLEALVMVRDADDDCKRDGLPPMPPLARAKIDSAIDKAEGRS